MSMLLVNAGSSSLKISVAEDGEVGYTRTVTTPPLQITDNEWRELIDDFTAHGGQIEVVVHRVAHGGPRFGEAAIVDDHVMAGIEQLSDLAPLHQPPSVSVLERLRKLLPDAVQIACFDTAFHARMPAESYTYAIPRDWREDLGVRRYGFHGLAHEYNVREAAQILDRDLYELHLVSAHLGSGASLAAVREGHSVDTTMGFTPLEGLVMSTRSGTIDPAISAWLVSKTGLSVTEVIRRLERESGLYGLAGDTHMGAIVDRANAAEAEAQLAMGVWAHRAAGMIGQMVVSAGGLDALVFSGGIGENSPVARAMVLERLRPLGLRFDEDLNLRNEMGSEIQAKGSSAAIIIVQTREDITMVRQAQALLRQHGH
ncbi:acetate/propionate family kinase [Pseudoclavibacter soli]|uniref:acetate/propionate family kinase n=1 Tax=Pseudoclavibacter soli TaxID=452623 RepID=UPI00041D1465|nr:acetate/propionate family kinase [Pseudoclavibacter soli]